MTITVVAIANAFLALAVVSALAEAA